LDLGLSHIQVSGILITVSLILTALALVLKNLRGLELSLILSILFGLFTFNLIILRKRKVSVARSVGKSVNGKTEIKSFQT
jgi:hypothetical protein